MASATVVRVIDIQVNDHLVGSPLYLALFVDTLTDWIAFLTTAEQLFASEPRLVLFICDVVALN